jgi:butyryl-CoA dehydrogenase
MYLLSKEQEKLRSDVRSFVDAEVIPVSAQLDAGGELPREIFKELGTRGYLDASFAFPGTEAHYNALDGTIIIEELSRGLASLGLIVSPHFQCAELIAAAGTEKLKAEVLPGAKNGDLLFSFAISEESGGSDALGVDTVVTSEGDSWVLNGKKCWITSAGSADGFIVTAKSPYAERSRSVSLFYVSRNAPGVSVHKSGDMIGLRNAPMYDVIMDNCIIPKHCLVGSENLAYPLFKPLLNEGRLDMAAVAIGISHRAIELAVERADKPGKFGRKLSSNQAIAFSIADMYAKNLAARQSTYYLASKMAAAMPHSVDAAAVKLFATESCRDICKAACQIYGASGLMTTETVNRLLRDAEMLTIAEGTSEICKIVISNGAINNGVK